MVLEDIMGEMVAEEMVAEERVAEEGVSEVTEAGSEDARVRWICWSLASWRREGRLERAIVRCSRHA